MAVATASKTRATAPNAANRYPACATERRARSETSASAAPPPASSTRLRRTIPAPTVMAPSISSTTSQTRSPVTVKTAAHPITQSKAYSDEQLPRLRADVESRFLAQADPTGDQAESGWHELPRFQADSARDEVARRRSADQRQVQVGAKPKRLRIEPKHAARDQQRKRREGGTLTGWTGLVGEGKARDARDRQEPEAQVAMHVDDGVPPEERQSDTAGDPDDQAEHADRRRVEDGVGAV